MNEIHFETFDRRQARTASEVSDQLSRRQAIIRRADLGAAGIYYRALVGSFASAEKATKLCNGLKAAGGDCIILKN
jgi:hypothetical protein